MKKLKNHLSITLILTLTLLTSSCAHKSLVKSSYDTLSISKSVYDTTMKTISDLDSRGLLNSDTKLKIIKAASIYSQAHNETVSALVNYQRSKSLPDQQRLELQLSTLSKSLNSLLTITKPLLEHCNE